MGYYDQGQLDGWVHDRGRNIFWFFLQPDGSQPGATQYRVNVKQPPDQLVRVLLESPLLGVFGRPVQQGIGSRIEVDAVLIMLLEPEQNRHRLIYHRTYMYDLRHKEAVWVYGSASPDSLGTILPPAMFKQYAPDYPAAAIFGYWEEDVSILRFVPSSSDDCKIPGFIWTEDGFKRECWR
jgi:hypothetical protein